MADDIEKFYHSLSFIVKLTAPAYHSRCRDEPMESSGIRGRSRSPRCQSKNSSSPSLLMSARVESLKVANYFAVIKVT